MAVPLNRLRFRLVVALVSIAAVWAAQAFAARGRTPAQLVQVQMKNVALHADEQTSLHVQQLRGAMVSTRPNAPAFFDDKNSFVVRIDSAEIDSTPDNLSRLMNAHMLEGGGAPLRDVEVGIDGSQ